MGLLMATVLLSVLVTEEVYAQTTTPTQDDIDGDGIPNNNDLHDDNDGKFDAIDNDDNDNITDSVDPILNTPEQQARPPSTTTTTTTPPPTTTTPQIPPPVPPPPTNDPEPQRFNQIYTDCVAMV